MQKLFIFLSLIIFSSSALLAEDIPTQPSNIETLISDIKSAKSSDRRVLMNQLKVQLRAMNQETRSKTMMSLRKSFNKNGSNQMQRNRQENRGNRQNNMQEKRGEQQPDNRPSQPMRDGQKKGK